MKEKILIYYIKFVEERNIMRGVFCLKKSFEICRGNVGGLNGICIKCSTDNKEKIFKLKKALEKYDYKEAAVFADKVMAKYMGMTDMMFQARKDELINNCEYIIQRLLEGHSENDSMTLVVNSTKWSIKELFYILSKVKNHYRQINVLTDSGTFNLERIAESMYEEWGVVLHIYPLKKHPLKCQDMVLFLVKDWNSVKNTRLLYNTAYVVADEDYLLRKDIDCEYPNNNSKRLFSGLVYKADNILPYELAVNLIWQKPVLCEKLDISVIDICELE